MERRILVGTTDGLHVLDGGGAVQLSGSEVISLTSDESGWWALVGTGEVWHTSEGGPWGRVAGLEDARGNCVQPFDGGLYVGASDAGLFSLQGGSLEPVSSFQEAEGRSTWYTPWGGPPDVRSMSADPAGGVYANVHVGGIVRSSDRGQSWQPTIDIHSDVHQVYFDAGSGLLLAASARGLEVSGDGGGTWRHDSTGLHGRYLRSVAVANETVLVGASTGPSTSRGAVYRRPVGSRESFQRCRNGLPEWIPDNIDTFCLAAAGAIACFGTSDGSVYLSTDEGESWEAAADGLPPVRSVALAVQD